ncbi:MAG: transposase, partial [Acidobacteriota bacterium]
MKHKEWKSTGSCVYNTWHHLVWSTKYRGKVLVAPIDEAAKKLFHEICQTHGYEIQGMEV